MQGWHELPVPLSMRKTNPKLGCIIYMCSLLLRLLLKHCTQFRSSRLRGRLANCSGSIGGWPDHEGLRAAALRLREMHLFNLAKILIGAYSHWKSNGKDDGVNLFSRDYIKKDNSHELWLGMLESHAEVMGVCFL